MRTLSPLLALAGGMALAAALPSAVPHARAQTGDPCAVLVGMVLGDAKVEIAEANLSGTLASGRGAVLTRLPGFCRVRGLATPTPRSNSKRAFFSDDPRFGAKHNEVSALLQILQAQADALFGADGIKN